MKLIGQIIEEAKICFLLVRSAVCFILLLLYIFYEGINNLLHLNIYIYYSLSMTLKQCGTEGHIVLYWVALEKNMGATLN